MTNEAACYSSKRHGKRAPKSIEMRIETLSLFFIAGLAAPAPVTDQNDEINDPARFTYYNSPTPLAGPCDLCTGPDGAIWAQNVLSDIITRIDPETGVVEEFDIPYENASGFTLQDLEPQQLALACAIQPGKDGMLYAAAGIRSQFLRINPTTKEIKVYTPPPPNNPLGNVLNFNDLWATDDGMYFTLTTANVLFHFDYKTEEFTPYVPPTPLAGPLGTFLASDGNIWICEFLASKMAKFDLSTKTFTEYPLPLGGLGPAVVRAESPPGTIWFTCFLGNSMGSINIYTGEVKIYPDPLPAALPTEDTVDGEGNIWYSTATRSTINKLDVKTGEITLVKQPVPLEIIPLPVSVPPLLNIAVHYGPGNAIWFTEVLNNRVGKYAL